jgi:aconitate hydratase
VRRTEVSVQYVGHNLLQTDSKNAEDHEFLRSVCRRFGLWYSRAGNDVSHPSHMQRFGIPGKTIVGSDSHIPAAGSLGRLAIGLGGIAVAMAMAGEPVYLRMPEIWGVRLTGELPAWGKRQGRHPGDAAPAWRLSLAQAPNKIEGHGQLQRDRM